MQLLVDGMVFEVAGHGGNLRIFQEVLPRLCALDPDFDIAIVTAGRPQQPLPYHERISNIIFPPFERLIRPGRLFLWSLQRPVRALVQMPWINHVSPFIWHSSYYTLPIRPHGPIVTTVLDLLHERYDDLFNRWDDDWFRKQKRRCVEQSDAILCISETTRRDVIDAFDVEAERVIAIPLAPSTAFRRLRAGELSVMQAGKPYLLYVGGRSHYKNFKMLLKTYAQWAHRREIDLLLVGSPLSPAETQVIIDLQMTSAVKVLSGISDQHLCEIYNQAVAFVYPSLYEGFGIPVLEAMASGCQLIASHIPSTVEIAGNVPIYFDPTRTDSLIAALDLALARHFDRDHQHLEQGIQRAANYSWDLTARRTLKMYQSLVSPA